MRAPRKWAGEARRYVEERAQHIVDAGKPPRVVTCPPTVLAALTQHRQSWNVLGAGGRTAPLSSICMGAITTTSSQLGTVSWKGA